jgi:hypothetical protein
LNPGRRVVRVRPRFFDRLDALLPEERTAEGRPSTTDFLAYELPAVIDRLAADYEGVAVGLPNGPDVRMHIAHGVLVAELVVFCVLAADGAIELVDLDVSHAAPAED